MAEYSIWKMIVVSSTVAAVAMPFWLRLFYLIRKRRAKKKESKDG